MIKIRLPKKNWGEAWRALIEVGPVTLISRDLTYEVLPVHVELLKARGFPFERVNPRNKGKGVARSR